MFTQGDKDKTLTLNFGVIRECFLVTLQFEELLLGISQIKCSGSHRSELSLLDL